MKLLVINPGFLPNPAVKGGAVENLMDMYLDSELLNDIEFVVYSRYDIKVENIKNKNSNVEYRYIKNDNYVKEQFDRVISKLSNYEIGNNYIKRIIKDIKTRHEEKDYDYIFIENTYQYVISLYNFFGNKIILHQHNCLNTKNINVCKKAIQRSYEIYTVSGFVKNQILSINEHKNVRVLFNGVKLEKFKFEPDKNLIDKYHLNNEDFVLCYVGRVVKEKGILELLEAFRKFSQNKNNVKLLIIGSESFSSSSDEFLEKCRSIIDDLKDKVIFTGFIDYNEINKYYSLADIQVVPSIVDDSCPMAVIEGMSVGLAQIVTNSGGIPEEVNDKNAIIVERKFLADNLYNSINKLYSNRELLSTMKKNSFARSRLFSDEKYVLTLKSYLNELDK